VLELREPDRAEIVELNRTTLRLWQWGDPAAPPVVLVHGAFDHGRMFDELAPAIAELGYHAVAIDVRGHGDSGRLGTGNVWWPALLDIVALARHLGGPVGLIGHSMGAGQTLTMAAAFPELARWAVSLDGLGPPGEAFADPDHAAQARKAFATVERIRSTPQRSYATVEEMAARRRQVNPRMSEAWSRHLALHGSRPVEGGFEWKSDPMFAISMPAPFDIDMLDAEQRAVRCPVLVLMGTEEDMWSDLPEIERERRIALMPDARLVNIGGAGHYVHLEQPAAVLDQIRTFLAEVGP
jgi:pimeloyl-ACP methyl ester carboxylesterase